MNYRDLEDALERNADERISLDAMIVHQAILAVMKKLDIETLVLDHEDLMNADTDEVEVFDGRFTRKRR